jgi:hypothetical protein
LYNFAAGPLSKLISTGKAAEETIKPEAAASSLLAGGKKGATDLAALRTEVPEAVDELAAAHLRSAKPWTNMSPEAQAALVPEVGARAVLNSAIPKTVSGLSTTNNLVRSLLGELGGEHLAPLVLGNALGLGHASDVGAVAGLTVPLLYQGGKAIAKNPLMLTGPAAGALAGAQQGGQ